MMTSSHSKNIEAGLKAVDTLVDPELYELRRTCLTFLRNSILILDNKFVCDPIEYREQIEKFALAISMKMSKIDELSGKRAYLDRCVSICSFAIGNLDKFK